MPDDLTNKGPQDRSRISLLEPNEAPACLITVATLAPPAAQYSRAARR
jgi:hypothetical protein